MQWPSAFVGDLLAKCSLSSIHTHSLFCVWMRLIPLLTSVPPLQFPPTSLVSLFWFLSICSPLIIHLSTHLPPPLLIHCTISRTGVYSDITGMRVGGKSKDRCPIAPGENSAGKVGGLRWDFLRQPTPTSMLMRESHVLSEVTAWPYLLLHPQRLPKRLLLSHSARFGQLSFNLLYSSGLCFCDVPERIPRSWVALKLHCAQCHGQPLGNSAYLAPGPHKVCAGELEREAALWQTLPPFICCKGE